MRKLVVVLAWLTIVSCSSTSKVSQTEQSYPAVANVNTAPEADRDPATISSAGGADYSMETCNLPKNEVYKILKNGSDMNRGGRTDANGCFKTTFRGGIVGPGDNLVIQVAGKNASSETVPKGQGGNSGGGTPNPGNGGGGGYNPPPQPTTDRVDINKVRNTAENNARCMANAVVAAYGRIESDRYNYYRGIREGMAIYSLSNLGSLRDTVEYKMGAQLGSGNGGNQGLEAGREAGRTEGARRGQLESRARHVEVLDKDSAPNLTLNVPNPSSGGLQVNASAVRTIDERLRAVDGEVQSWVRSQQYGYDGWAIDGWSDRWSPTIVYGWNSYQFDLVRSWYRDDWAFQIWKERRFSRCSDQVNYYDKIRDPSQTTNYSEAESAFRNTFKNVYDGVFDNKWRNEVEKPNPVPFAFGRNLGFRISQEYAKDVGYQNGFLLAYGEASQQGKEETFAGAYTDAFTSRNNQLQNSMELEGLTADIKPLSGATYGVGTPVAVVVKSLQNIGRQNGEAKISVAGNASQLENKSIKMDYSKSLKEPVVFQGYAAISTNGAPDQSSSVVVRAENQSVTLPITVDWATTIRNYVAGAPATRSTILAYMKTHLKTEWESVKKGLGGDKYKANSAVDTLLEKLVVTTAGLTAEQKAVIKSSADDLAKVLGEKPSFVNFDDKSKYNSGMELYKKLK